MLNYLLTVWFMKQRTRFGLLKGPLFFSTLVGTIWRANLDGSGQEPLISGLISPTGFALDSEARLHPPIADLKRLCEVPPQL